MREPVMLGLGVTALAAGAHMHLPDAARAFVVSKTTGTARAAAQGPEPGQFTRWALGFAGLSVVLAGLSESETWGEAAEALSMLVAFGAVALYWPDIAALFQATPSAAAGAAPAAVPQETGARRSPTPANVSR